MILQAVVGFLVVVLALLAPSVPKRLYEDNFLDKTQAILGTDFSSVLFEKPTTVAVTGANSGLGFAAVQHLARRAVHNKHESVQMTIVMACRSMDRCNKAKSDILEQVDPAKQYSAKLHLLPLQLDLADRESIQKFAAHLQDAIPRPITTITRTNEEGEEYQESIAGVPPLHVMIHNAGVCAPYPQLEYHSANELETHFHVNYAGHVLLTHYIWTNVMAVHEQDPTRKHRFVTVSEGGALFNVDPMKGWYKDENGSNAGILAPLLNMVTNMKQYARSKEGQLFFAAELQSKYRDFISTSAAQPGYTLTPIYLTNFNGFPTILKHIVAHFPLLSMSPEQGSLTILLSTLDEQAQYVGPQWFFFGPPVAVSRSENLNTGSVHHRAFSRQRTMALWDRTMKVLGIAEFGKTSYVTE
jgi:NAD(P)-dependent dehydrogenase (short-subunit alcohol dehydrogenase family)